METHIMCGLHGRQRRVGVGAYIRQAAPSMKLDAEASRVDSESGFRDRDQLVPSLEGKVGITRAIALQPWSGRWSDGVRRPIKKVGGTSTRPPLESHIAISAPN
jgi:hypothetical protein